MTIILVVRSVEGIAIVTDTVTTATETRTLDDDSGKSSKVQYHIYNRKKLSRIGKFAVVHAGLSFLNGKTINQIVDRIPHDTSTESHSCIEEVKTRFFEELEKDPIVERFEKGTILLSLGVIGYKDKKPFVFRLIFLRSEKDDEILELIESEDAFVSPYYGIDYFGDYEFLQLVIRAAKKENLLKPFDILTINESLDLARTLIRFLIEFQRYMVEFTVAYPIESAVITLEDGFEWVDKMQFKKFHYDTEPHY